MKEQTLQGYFINLEESRERSLQMQDSLDRLGLSQIVKRFPALRSPIAKKHLSPAEHGCLLSHWTIIERADPDLNLLVLEDDTELSSRLPALLRKLPETMRDLSMDIVFLGQTVEYGDVKTHAKLLKAFNQLQANSHASIMLDAQKFYRWGAFGYVIAPQALEKISTLLRQNVEHVDAVPIDNFFKHLLRSQAIKGGIVFPYVVGVNASLGTTMQQRSFAHEHDLHASLVNQYLHGSQVPDESELWRTVLQGTNDPRALALCMRIYQSLTAATKTAKSSLDTSGAASGLG